MLHVYPPLHGQLEGNAKFEFKDKRALFFCTFWHQQLFWVATLISMGTILGRAIFIRGDVSGKCVKCQFQFSYVLGESCNLRNSHNSCIFDVRACPDDLVPLWSSMENIFRMWLTSVQVAVQSLAGTKKHRKTPLTSQYQTRLSLPF